jgi:hypothetical protein
MEKEMITPGALEAVLTNPFPSEPFDKVCKSSVFYERIIIMAKTGHEYCMP